MKQASGTFEVTMKPHSQAGETMEKPAADALGRMSLEKQFDGNLVAVSTGEMLTAMTQTEDFAGYVAIERSLGGWMGWRVALSSNISG